MKLVFLEKPCIPSGNAQGTSANVDPGTIGTESGAQGGGGEPGLNKNNQIPDNRTVETSTTTNFLPEPPGKGHDVSDIGTKSKFPASVFTSLSLGIIINIGVWLSLNFFGGVFPFSFKSLNFRVG